MTGQERETMSEALKTTELICISCPMGCSLEVTHDGETVVSVAGNVCKRGLEYAKGEIADPRRMVASTVRVAGGVHPLVPVYTDSPFPKPRIFDLLARLRQVELQAPVEVNEPVLRNALGTGVDVLASRKLPLSDE
jgi:CxxC motif-containing protein